MKETVHLLIHICTVRLFCQNNVDYRLQNNVNTRCRSNFQIQRVFNVVLTSVPDIEPTPLYNIGTMLTNYDDPTKCFWHCSDISKLLSNFGTTSTNYINPIFI